VTPDHARSAGALSDQPSTSYERSERSPRVDVVGTAAIFFDTLEAEGRLAGAAERTGER